MNIRNMKHDENVPLAPVAKDSVNSFPTDFGIMTTGIVILINVSFSEQTILYSSEQIKQIISQVLN
jgi:hypothetical protein